MEPILEEAEVWGDDCPPLFGRKDTHLLTHCPPQSTSVSIPGPPRSRRRMNDRPVPYELGYRHGWFTDAGVVERPSSPNGLRCQLSTLILGADARRHSAGRCG